MAGSWGCSSAGRAPGLQPGGHRFDPGQLHQKNRLQASGSGLQERADAQEMTMEEILRLGPFLVPIVAVVVAGAVAIVVLVLRHQERIAKIERGIDPDAPRR